MKFCILAPDVLPRLECVDAVIPRSEFIAFVIFAVGKLLRNTCGVNQSILGIERARCKTKYEIIDFRAATYHRLTNRQRQHTSLNARCSSSIDRKFVEIDAPH